MRKKQAKKLRKAAAAIAVLTNADTKKVHKDLKKVHKKLNRNEKAN